MVCIYDAGRPRKATTHLTASGNSSVRSRSRSRSAADESSPKIKALDFPESRKRRLLELRLLHQYTTSTSLTLLAPPSSIQAEVWSVMIPRLAFQDDALLYSVLSTSALHLAMIESQSLEFLDAHRFYVDLTLGEHKNDIANLSKSNADALCLTSSLLRVTAMASLQERSYIPYTPPTQWLRMTAGTGRVFHATWDFIKDDEASIAMRLVNREAKLSPLNEKLFAESNSQRLAHLLRAADVAEPWDEDIQEAYGCTINYIGSIQLAIDARESPAEVCRRLVAFGFLCPLRFVNLVAEQRPRALLVLAHFFALLVLFREPWWVVDTPQKEVHGI